MSLATRREGNLFHKHCGSSPFKGMEGRGWRARLLPPSQEQKRRVARSTSFSKTHSGEDKARAPVLLPSSPWPSSSGETLAGKALPAGGTDKIKISFPSVEPSVLGSGVMSPQIGSDCATALPGLDLFKDHGYSPSSSQRILEDEEPPGTLSQSLETCQPPEPWPGRSREQRGRINIIRSPQSR